MRLKNIFLYWLLKLPWKQNDPQRKRFLIVSTTGLGDTLWGTPAIRALRQKYPQAYIAVLTSTMGKEVLQGNPHLDEIFVVKEPALFSLLLLYPVLKKREISKVFVFHTSQRPILPFCRMIGAAQIAGTEGINKGMDFLFSEPYKPKYQHEISRRLEIAGVDSDPFMEISSSPEEADPILKKISPYVPIVGLHGGSKDKFKQWPPELFARLGQMLKDHLGAQIIVTGGTFEKDLVESIASQIEGAIPITGGLSVQGLASLIGKMNLFISNDTGPMHIAFAVKTPTVALFSPTDPKLCGPLQIAKSIVIHKRRTCTPCLKKKCREPFCMLQISPQEVYAAALKLYYEYTT